METDQDLRPCFSQPQPRQGRSLSLPTLPFQKTNRYAVVGAMQATNRPLTINIFAWGTPHQSKPLRGNWRNTSHKETAYNKRIGMELTPLIQTIAR